MIKAWIVGTDAVIARLDQIPPQVNSALRAAVENAAKDLRGYVQESKLSGQVLRNRSGILRGSIHYEMREGGSRIAAAVGTNVKYAAIHEYGFDGTEAVKAHTRRITQAFGRSLGRTIEVQVRGFSRHMLMPERSFLRSALADKADSIRRAIEEAVAAGVKG